MPAELRLRPRRGGSRSSAARGGRSSGAGGTDGTGGSRRSGGSGRSSRRPRRRAVLLVLLALVVLGLAYAGAAAALSGRVPRGTSAAGIDLGGMSRAQAEAALSEGLATAVTAPLAVTAGDRDGELDPVAAGLVLDSAATAERAAGPAGHPLTLWRQLVGGGEVTPVTDVDDAALAAALADLAAAVDVPPVEGAIAFADGVPTPTEPAAGEVLDVERAAGVLAERWLTGGGPLALPVVVREPEVGAAAVERAMTELAGPAMSAPITVVVGTTSVELAPAQVAAALSTAPADGALELSVDGAALAAAVAEVAPEALTPAQDARLEVRDGAVAVVPGVDGTGFDPAALSGAAGAALTGTTPAERTLTPALVPVEPETSTADAEALGVQEVVSEFSTKLTADAQRTENLRIAARTVNGTLMLPGDTFSLNEVLGERTPEKGYNKAPAISGGRLVADYGGGVSQVATTLFNAMYFAGLKDVEHKPHSFYISRYPVGREATVNYPTVDLKFTNDSPHGVLIETWLAGGEMHARFWSTKVWDVTSETSARRNVKPPQTIVDDSQGCVKQAPSEGFDVTVTRTSTRAGEAPRVEEFRTHYIPEDSVTCTFGTATAAPPAEDVPVAPAPAPVG